MPRARNPCFVFGGSFSSSFQILNFPIFEKKFVTVLDSSYLVSASFHVFAFYGLVLNPTCWRKTFHKNIRVSFKIRNFQFKSKRVHFALG